MKSNKTRITYFNYIQNLLLFTTGLLIRQSLGSNMCWWSQQGWQVYIFYFRFCQEQPFPKIASNIIISLFLLKEIKIANKSHAFIPYTTMWQLHETTTKNSPRSKCLNFNRFVLQMADVLQREVTLNLMSVWTTCYPLQEFFCIDECYWDINGILTLLAKKKNSRKISQVDIEG